MDATSQNPLCIDAGTRIPPAVTHTSPPGHETTTILTTLLGVAEKEGGPYVLSTGELEGYLGGNIGVIGALSGLK